MEYDQIIHKKGIGIGLWVILPVDQSIILLFIFSAESHLLKRITKEIDIIYKDYDWTLDLDILTDL